MALELSPDCLECRFCGGLDLQLGALLMSATRCTCTQIQELYASTDSSSGSACMQLARYQPIARNALLQLQVLCIESVHTGNVREDNSRVLALCHAKPSPSSLKATPAQAGNSKTIMGETHCLQSFNGWMRWWVITLISICHRL